MSNPDIQSKITALLTEAHEKAEAANGNLQIFLQRWHPVALTAGRSLELLEQVLDDIWGAYECALKASTLEDVRKELEGGAK